MGETRQELVEKLLKSYEAYFNIERFEDAPTAGLVARCDFFEHSEKYVMSRKAELWSADCEEFIYLFSMEHLTEERFAACKAYALSDGKERMHIGPGHMYTYITAVFLCDDSDEYARKALKKSREYKSFHFSLHGWMDYHNAMLEVRKGAITSNYAGRPTAKILKKVLFSNKKKRSESI